MKNQIWNYNVKHGAIFSYVIILPLNKISFKEKVLSMDEVILRLGNRFGIYDISKIIPNHTFEDILTNYLGDRKRNFFKKETIKRYVGLIDFEQWEAFRKNILHGNHLWAEYTRIPIFDEGKIIYTDINASLYRTEPNIIDLDVHADYSYEKLQNKPDLEFDTNLSITSYNNIWKQTLEVIQENGSLRTPEKPFNNRPIAYRIVPRFNSFLRGITRKVKELGGSIVLDDYRREFVNIDGILLDGEIIYQEDIDEGRVEVP